jgi:hypothetical protein
MPFSDEITSLYLEPPTWGDFELRWAAANSDSSRQGAFIAGPDDLPLTNTFVIQSSSLDIGGKD